ncbi:hypothetical protein HMPREF1219_01545 [Corynebacterium pyruviciproducens ATCC BAA-1742]|uniref:DUF306 domain-containing protein n=1 Tax=Corynebacterium pyruviciproducens ATCC BAA-1742 TaxID=1125779 RepID=S2Z260_9CORY|nr:META domain-containing protein [Corynebacterium pyruviciproducens]EPD68365.1 hypothetical protein HMPREF1219_01545 [Corynebacterium pyruviciproducens ATCC BAA-1742]
MFTLAHSAVALTTLLSSTFGAPVPATSDPALLLTASHIAAHPAATEADQLLTGSWHAVDFPAVTLDFSAPSKLTYQGDCNPTSQADATLTPEGTLVVTGGGTTRMACSPEENELGQQLRSVLLAHPQVLAGDHGELVLQHGDKRIAFQR